VDRPEDTAGSDAPIAMRVDGVVVDPQTQTPVVILRSIDEPRLYLPIFIGGLEATAIATCLAGITLPRPMTHDLMTSALEAVKCKVASVAITRIEAGTFFAHLTLVDPHGGELVLDARPSDALALALRAAAPIAVGRQVLAEAGGFAESDAPPAAEGESSGEDAPPAHGAPDAAAPAPDAAAPAPGGEPQPAEPLAPRPVDAESRLEDLEPEVFGKYKM
jgi:bifunctional DNase/RNase